MAEVVIDGIDVKVDELGFESEVVLLLEFFTGHSNLHSLLNVVLSYNLSYFVKFLEPK